MLERRTRTAARRMRARRAGRLAFAAVGALAAAVLAVDAADAARLLKVRVGRHAGFVRVVFETDAPTRFAIEPRVEPAEALVRIDAADAPAQISAPPGAGAEVRLEALPGGGTLARIRANEPVVVESQVLPGPPRIVFDLRPGAPELAAAPPPEPPVERPLVTELPVQAPAEEPPPEVEAPAAEDAERPPPVLAPEIREPSLFSELAPPLTLENELGEPPDAPAPKPGAEPEPEPGSMPGSTSEPAPHPPAVSAAPPAAVATRLDDRSLVLGAAGGLALGLGLALLARGRAHHGAAAGGGDAELAPLPLPPLELPRDSASRPPGPPEPAFEDELGAEATPPKLPIEPAPLPPLPTAEWPAASDSLAADLIAMIQRLDERCARTESALVALLERSERLERRSVADAEELGAHRAALTRLDRALDRPLAAPPSPLDPAMVAARPRQR